MTLQPVFVTLSIAILAISVTTTTQAQDSMRKTSAPAIWNAKGELLQPVGYREWIFVGTPVTPNDMNDGKAAFPEFHNVYIDPASYAKYKTTGEFPDGTVMVKELVSVGSKAASSGSGYFEGEFIGLEASVKSADKHAKEPGNWGYYSFTQPGAEPLKMTSIKATASCNACHQSSAKQDYVFSQYYPVLRAAAKH